jgi:hypothetical protein
VVSVPQLLDGGRSPFVAATAFDLGAVDYLRAEYALSGRAVAYARTDGGVESTEEAEFTTRLLVHRPVDPAAFNGTVWIEWLNVSGGLDAAPVWIYAHTELLRTGAVWVGVSAQEIGVQGGTGLLGLPSRGLVGIDPERYGGLHHPGDRFSYDIYTQATSAVRRAVGTVLEGLDIRQVLAAGESQSAFRLTTYANDIDPVARIHDGFLVHARGKSAASLDDLSGPTRAVEGDPVLFRDDLRVPVLCVESEGDLMVLGYREARQTDGPRLAVWEIAGAAHADMYTFAGGPVDTGRLPLAQLAATWVPVREVYGMQVDQLINAGPQHYVVNAAVRHLERWARLGTRPPAAPRLEVLGGGLATDGLGNARGGIRTPHVDVPTAVLSGTGNSGHPVAFLCGRTVPFDAATLARLYPSSADYLRRFGAATDGAVAAGFVLADDADEIKGIAALNSPL